MILTCELCQSLFLTESDPHVIIPGPETKVYCYCQVKGNEQKWIDQLKHEHKLYQKHLSGLKAENERLEAENAKLRECVEFYAETGNWTWSTSLLESSTLREVYDSDMSWTDTGGTYGEILSGGKHARQVLKELEK